MAYYSRLSFKAIQAGITGREFSVAANSPADRIWMRLPIFILMLSMFVVLSCAEQPTSKLDEGLGFYRQNKLKEACPLLEQAVEQDPQNPEAYAWLAETYRRLGQTDKAVSTAQKAIDIDPCNSFAHTVLAWTYNPQYGSWEEADAESTWHHLLRAAECDSTDGNVWIGVWVEAIRRGERALERKALRLLIETGFLTPPLLSYNRWMLRHLPENALLLTNGDWDTYPAVALQEVEHFRPDVVVVNRSLLNTTWYARLLRDRYTIPLPFEDAELGSLRAYRDENENLVLISNQIVRGWLNQRKSGVFPRPIAISVTVGDLSFASDTQDHLQFAGAFWLWLPEPTESPQDTVMLRVSLADINTDDFTGSFVSPEDRSPVRMVHGDRLVRNVTAASLRYSQALLESQRFSEAYKMIRWAEQFEKKTELGPVSTEQIEKLKEAARQGME
jgi:tetratricopeptide (TPR) repeat protein